MHRAKRLVDILEFNVHVSFLIKRNYQVKTNKKGGRLYAFPPTHDEVTAGNALAFHAFEQLRQVPDLLIGGNFAIGQVDGAILQVDRTGPQVQTASQLGNEFIQLGGRFGAQAIALYEADRAGVRIVDVSPVRAVPLEILCPGAINGGSEWSAR